MVMRTTTFGIGLLALVLAAGPVAAAPTDRDQDQNVRTRPRITIHPRRLEPGPNSKRHCEAWLQKEYRVSGPVITPQMRCWWD